LNWDLKAIYFGFGIGTHKSDKPTQGVCLPQEKLTLGRDSPMPERKGTKDKERTKKETSSGKPYSRKSMQHDSTIRQKINR